MLRSLLVCVAAAAVGCAGPARREAARPAVDPVTFSVPAEASMLALLERIDAWGRAQGFTRRTCRLAFGGRLDGGRDVVLAAGTVAVAGTLSCDGKEAGRLLTARVALAKTLYRDARTGAWGLSTLHLEHGPRGGVYLGQEAEPFQIVVASRAAAGDVVASLKKVPEGRVDLLMVTVADEPAKGTGAAEDKDAPAAKAGAAAAGEAGADVALSWDAVRPILDAARPDLAACVPPTWRERSFVFEWTVTPAGRVTKVWRYGAPTDRGKDERAIEECLSGELAALVFPKSRGAYLKVPWVLDDSPPPWAVAAPRPSQRPRAPQPARTRLIPPPAEVTLAGPEDRTLLDVFDAVSAFAVEHTTADDCWFVVGAEVAGATRATIAAGTTRASGSLVCDEATYRDLIGARVSTMSIHFADLDEGWGVTGSMFGYTAEGGAVIRDSDNMFLAMIGHLSDAKYWLKRLGEGPVHDGDVEILAVPIGRSRIVEEVTAMADFMRPGAASAPSAGSASSGESSGGSSETSDAAGGAPELDWDVIVPVIRAARAQLIECLPPPARWTRTKAKFVFVWQISPTGDVPDDSLENPSALVDGDVAQVVACMTRILAAQTFPASAGGTLEVPFTFEASEIRKAAALPAAVTVNPGGLTTAEVRRHVQRKHIEIHACWQRRLADKPTLADKLVARFLIDASGKVLQASVTGLDDSAVETCVADVIRGIRFSKTDTQTDVTAYPFVFSKTGVNKGDVN